MKQAIKILAVSIMFGSAIFCKNALADIAFTTTAIYTQPPLFFGKGIWTIERSPLGSGLPLASPQDSSNGFVFADKTIFRYVATSDAVGTSVGFSWAIERGYLANDGELFTLHSQFAYTAQLLDSKGKSSATFFDMTTVHPLIGGGAIARDESGSRVLPVNGDVESIHAESFASLIIPPSGGGRLVQGGLLVLGPSAAGQEFLIEFDGVVSEVFRSNITSGVPEPASLAVWMGVGIIGYISFNLRKTTPWRRSLGG
ncbi:MAG: hypothetical protein SFX18_19505 [Pirellulales bacterium]|nr:hypothetical protein [Pirellulales bacterium]